MYSKTHGPIDLEEKICLVTGGSRGIGKGIALQLAYYGATCYVTGRNLETLKNLNKEVEDIGGSGRCIPVQCDHANDDEVKKLFERIDKENNGKLDLLVNNAYSAANHLFSTIGTDFWEDSLDAWDLINNVGLRNNYRCAIYASRLMVEKRQGLIINLSSLAGLQYVLSVPYGIGKCANDRMAQDCATELKKYKVAFISLWPGAVATELLNSMDENNDYFKRYKDFIDLAESPTYIGKVVAALVSENQDDVMQKSGKVLLTTDIGAEHGVKDEKGIMPTGFSNLNYLLEVSGWKRLSRFIPNFIKIPLWFTRTMATFRHS